MILYKHINFTLMKKLFASFGLFALFFSFVPNASADVMRNARGSVVVNKGTVYFVGANTLYPFPSMQVFLSYGHVPSDIKPANAADMALKMGPVATLNNRPFGHLDEITADGKIRGWAVDRDHLNSTSGITLWAFYNQPYNATGNFSSAGGVTQKTRLDVNSTLGISGNHGFEFSVSETYKDGKPHTVYVYAVDNESPDKPVQLIGSPKQFTISADQTSVNDDEFNNQFNDGMVLIGVFSIIEKLHEYKETNGVFPSTLAGAGIVLSEVTITAYGACSQSDMNIVYTPNSNYTSYTLKYCLGTNSIYSGFSNDEDLADLKEMFKAGINIMDYTIVEQIILLMTEESSVKARDAKRLADIRNLQTGVEIYYNNHGSYPYDLIDLSSIMPVVVPTAPMPVDGNCTLLENTYTYTRLANGQDYRLTFCLGGSVSGYSAGVRTATPAGIN